MPIIASVVKKTACRPWLVCYVVVELALYLSECYLSGIINNTPSVIIAITTCAAMCASVFSPRIGTWIALGCFLMNMLTPFSMPTIVGTAVMCSAGLLSAITRFDGYCATPLIILSMFINSHINTAAGAMSVSDALSGTIVQLGICAIGTSFRLRQQQHEIRQREALAQDRLKLAGKLHDSVSNELTNALMILDAGQENAPRVKYFLEQTLDDVHQLIMTLEQHTDNNAASSTAAASMSAWDTVPKIIKHEKELLLEAGFEGEVFFPSQSISLRSDEKVELLGNIIKESFTNIRRYANRMYPYVWSLSVSDTALILRVTDVPNSSSSANLRGLSSGMRRHQAALATLGGTMTVDQHDGRWSVSMTLPLDEPQTKP